MNFFVLKFLFLILITLPAGAKNQCAQIFTKDIEKLILDLAKLRLQLDLDKAQGQHPIEITALNADYKSKEQQLGQYVEDRQLMTSAELIEKIKLQIIELQNQDPLQKENAKDQENRLKEQQQKLRDKIMDGTEAVFHYIKPGAFKMGDPQKPVDVTITKPFELMATLTTQFLYKEIVDLAHKYFGGKFILEAQPSFFKGSTRPVENIEYAMVQNWLMALNTMSENGEPALEKLIRGHKKGDHYRLPTDAEWEFVVRGRGVYNQKYHFGEDALLLPDYAWTYENSNNQTHPVAERKPLYVDDMAFYDMLGNVSEWTLDSFDNVLHGGKDPLLQLSPKAAHVVRGGSYSTELWTLYFESAARPALPPTTASRGTGFRLVRAPK